jgi:acetyl-CoA C-acetyltransferase
MTIRMAAHAIKAGEGDCFVAAGVETVSRYVHGMADGPHNPTFEKAEARTAKMAEGNEADWAPHDGLPDLYIAMGQTAETWPVQAGQPQAQDELCRPLPEPGRGQPGQRLLGGGDHPDHAARRHRGEDDDGIRRGDREAVGLNPVFRPGGDRW